MAETYRSPSSYDPRKFINREEEIKQITSLLQQSQPRVRAIVVDGNRGAGKTWLSLHLHRTVFKNETKGLTSWLFGLWSPGENYRPEGETPQPNERFVREKDKLEIEEFLAIILNSLSIELAPKTVLAEKVEAIRNYVHTHSDSRFAIILDSAYESDWALLEQLEAHFLGNLLTLNNFFVIVTGRGRPYPWKIPFLIEAVRFGLGQFSVEQIKEQLEKFGLSSILSVDEIFDIGQGWPLFTEQLARAKNRAEALDTAEDILFAVIQRQEREQIRKYFEALCPLDGFGETEAALMVKTYDQNEAQDGRAICKKMNATRMISWKNGRYVMNEPVLKILRQYLPVKNKDTWIRLHCAAYRHFEAQSRERVMERFKPFFEELMQNHSKALMEAGIKNPKDCLASKNEEN
jgi:hypothetical protein